MSTVGGIKAGRAFILIDAIDRTGKVLDGIKHKLGRHAAAMSSIGTTMAIRAAAALTPVAMATKVYSDFDDSMRRVQARSAGTSAEMDTLREQALKLGATTAFTSAQVGKLQAKLAQKGFDRKSIFNMTDGVLALASAAGTGDLEMDVQNAADLVSGTMRAYQLEAGESARVADLMAAMVNNSNYSLEELTVSLAYAATTAKNFNMPLEDTLAMLASMRDLNIDASIAGTALRNMMNYSSKQDERDKFNERLSEMTGTVIDFTDERGNLRNMRDILLSINKAVLPLGTAQRAEMYDMLFETRAAVPASAVGKSVDTLARMLTIFDNANGLAKKTQATMETGLGGGFRELESRVESVALAIGGALDFSLRNLVNDLNFGLGAVTEWVSENQGLVAIVVAATAGFLGLGLSLIIVGNLAMTLLTPLLSLITLITGLTALTFTFVVPWIAAAAGIALGTKAIAEFIGQGQRLDDALSSGSDTAATFIAGRAAAVSQYLTEIGTALYDFWNDTVSHMAKALERGDVETAAKIFWKSLQVQWTEGANMLMGTLDELKFQIKSALAGGTNNPFLITDPNSKVAKRGQKDWDSTVRAIEYAYGYAPGAAMEKDNPALASANKRIKFLEGSIASRESGIQQLKGNPTPFNRSLMVGFEKDIDRYKAEIEKLSNLPKKVGVYGSGPINWARKMRDEYASKIQAQADAAKDKDAALRAPVDAAHKERADALAKTKAELEALKKENNDAVTTTPDLSNPVLDFESKLDELLKGPEKLITPADALFGDGGLKAADALVGLESHTAEAAKAFIENKNQNVMTEKLSTIATATKDSADSLKKIEGNMAASDASLFAV